MLLTSNTVFKPVQYLAERVVSVGVVARRSRHASLGWLLAAGLRRRRPRAHDLDRGARLVSRVLGSASRVCAHKDSQYLSPEHRESGEHTGRLGDAFGCYPLQITTTKILHLIRQQILKTLHLTFRKLIW